MVLEHEVYGLQVVQEALLKVDKSFPDVTLQISRGSKEGPLTLDLDWCEAYIESKYIDKIYEYTENSI